MCPSTEVFGKYWLSDEDLLPKSENLLKVKAIFNLPSPQRDRQREEDEVKIEQRYDINERSVSTEPVEAQT